MASHYPLFDGQDGPYEVNIELYPGISPGKHDYADFLPQRARELVSKLSLGLWSRPSWNTPFGMGGDLPAYQGWWFRDPIPYYQEESLDRHICY